MGVRHVDGAGAEFYALGGSGDPGDERDAGGDVFRLVGGVLADIALGIAEFVREQERFAVLLQRLPPVLADRMHRHGEESELHSICASSITSRDAPVARHSVIPELAPDFWIPGSREEGAPRNDETCFVAAIITTSKVGDTEIIAR